MGLFDFFKKAKEDILDEYDLFYNECRQISEEYLFDRSVLDPIKEMLDTAKKQKAKLPPMNRRQAAATAVFNATAENLMHHKYHIGSKVLNTAGELNLKELKRLGQNMVNDNYVSSTEMEELLSHIIEVTFTE